MKSPKTCRAPLEFTCMGMSAEKVSVMRTEGASWRFQVNEEEQHTHYSSPVCSPEGNSQVCVVQLHLHQLGAGHLWREMEKKENFHHTTMSLYELQFSKSTCNLTQNQNHKFGPN